MSLSFQSADFIFQRQSFKPLIPVAEYLTFEIQPYLVVKIFKPQIPVAEHEN